MTSPCCALVVPTRVANLTSHAALLPFELARPFFAAGGVLKPPSGENNKVEMFCFYENGAKTGQARVPYIMSVAVELLSATKGHCIRTHKKRAPVPQVSCIVSVVVESL